MQLDFLYTKKFMLIAYGFTGNTFDAEDIIQDVALKLLRYSNRSQDELQKMARVSIKNRYIDLKRMKHTTYELLENYDSPISSFEKRMMDKERIQQVSKRLRSVKEHDAEAFILSINGYGQYAISNAFSEKVNTVLGRIFRVRKFLKQTA